jgi:hypothetical protein
LVLEKEGEGEVASHVAICFDLALTGKLLFVFEAFVLTLLKSLVLLEFLRVAPRLVPFHQLKVVRRLILVDADVQVLKLNELRSGLRRLEVVDKDVLGACQLDAVVDCFLLLFKGYGVGHHLVLQELHEALLVLRKLLDETLEGIPDLGLGGLASTAEELRYAVLQNFVDEVLVAKGLLLLSVLADHAHQFAEAVGVVDGHLDARQRFRLQQ